jgi:hypothetical protein
VPPSGSVTGSTVLTVTPPPALQSLAVTPANPSIGIGGIQQFTATGTFSDGSTQNLTTSVTWASSSTGVATISNTSGTQGRATGVATGTTTISATSGTVTGSTVLTVTAGGAPITFVQTAGASDDSVGGTIAQAFSAANTAGNLIVVAVSWGDNPAPNIRAPTRSATPIWSPSTISTRAIARASRLCTRSTVAPAPNTVTVTLGTTGGYRRVIVSEYSGIATTAPLDVTAKSQGTSTTAANGATSTAATTTANGNLIFGVTMDDSGNFATINAGTGFTRRASLNGMDIATEDSIQATAGSVAATFTYSRADRYLAQMAAFKAASTGGGGSPVVSSLVCNPTSLNPERLDHVHRHPESTGA